MSTKHNDSQNNILPFTGIEFKFYYVSEVAAMLRVSAPVIYDLIHEGKLEAVKIGQAWKIPTDAVSRYISSLVNRLNE
jgi:excisionase family DNA binding protein